MREYVWLECSACGERNYRVQKETRGANRLELKKYCPRERKHTAHKESRKKVGAGDGRQTPALQGGNGLFTPAKRPTASFNPCPLGKGDVIHDTGQKSHREFSSICCPIHLESKV